MGFFNKFKEVMTKEIHFGSKKETTPIQQESTIIETANKIVEENDYYQFPVAGVSFHDKELKKIINNNLKIGKLEKFKGFTNRDLIDNGLTLDIYECQPLDGVKLEMYKYNGKDAIKVLLDDTTGNYIEIGSVPNNHLQKMLEILNKEIIKISFEIMGGIRKTPTIDDDDKDIVETENLNYGVLIMIDYK